MRSTFIFHKRNVCLSAFWLFVLICLVLNCCSWPILYLNSQSFDKQVNRQIKNLILTSLKDLFLITDILDNSDIYYQLDGEKIIQCNNNSGVKKSLLFVVEKNFMNNIRKLDDNTYEGIVKVYFPEEYFCRIKIVCTENGYKISCFQLDV